MIAEMKKKVLIISPIFPYPLESGGQVRIFNLIKHLADRFDIALLSPIGEGQEDLISALRPYCYRIETVAVPLPGDLRGKLVSLLRPSQLGRQVRRLSQWLGGIPLGVCRFYHPAIEAKLAQMLRSEHYDVVEAIYSQMAPYLQQAHAIDENAKTILEEIDMGFVTKGREFSTRTGLGRMLGRLEYQRMRNYTASTWSGFDEIIAMSDVDKSKLLDLEPQLRVSVIANGVDVDYFQPAAPSNSDQTLAFLGGSLHYPNVDALNYFCRDILPAVSRRLPDISLTVIGDFRPECLRDGGEGVRYTGFVNDLRPYLKECRALIVPLRIGGGTRLKILEAMAMGIPVVSTTIGCEGIEAQPDRDVLIADTPEEFGKAIESVWHDELLRKRLAQNGRALVEEKYSWHRIADQLAAVYEEAK